MPPGATLAKVTAKTAAEVCTKFPLSDDGRKLLADGLEPGPYLNLLIENKHYPDAVRFLAHALPKPEAVWWACLCARQAHGSDAPPAVATAIQVAEKWVADPSEDNRRAAQTAAEAAEFETPAGCAAVAAFWSGGSLAPPNLPVVPPPDHLTGHGAASAVIMAGIIREPQKAQDKYRAFLVAGLEVASGKNRWKEAPPRPPEAKIEKPPPVPEAPPATKPPQKKRW